MNNKLKEVLTTCFITIFVFLLIGYLVSIYSNSIYKKYDNYITLEGTIIDTWQESHFTSHNSSRIYYYTKFTYQIDGKYFQNTTQGGNYQNLKSSSITLLVNPNDFQDSIIKKDKEIYKALPFIMFGSILVISAIMVTVNVIAVCRQTKKHS